MLNSVILSGTVRNVEERGSIRIVTIEGMARNWKTKQDEPTLFIFKCFGDRTGLVPGTVVAVQGSVECREYNGKHYTDIIARDFEILGTAPKPSARPFGSPPAKAPPAKAPPPSDDDGWGDAPF